MKVTAMDSFQDVEGFGASPDGLGYSGFGDDAVAVPQQPVAAQVANPMRGTLLTLYAIASLAGTAVGAYHGYRRNDSVGWAIGWAFLGGLFPVVVIPVAFAQGIGDRK